MHLLFLKAPCTVLTQAIENLHVFSFENYQVHSIILQSEIYSTTSAPPLCFVTPAPFVLKLKCILNTVIAPTFVLFCKIKEKRYSWYFKRNKLITRDCDISPYIFFFHCVVFKHSRMCFVIGNSFKNLPICSVFSPLQSKTSSF